MSPWTILTLKSYASNCADNTRMNDLLNDARTQTITRIKSDALPGTLFRDLCYVHYKLL